LGNVSVYDIAIPAYTAPGTDGDGTTPPPPGTGVERPIIDTSDPQVPAVVVEVPETDVD
jgi:hypothetical protein